MKKAVFALMVAYLLCHAPPSLARPLRPFTPDSLDAIAKANRGHALLVVFWSGECPPCMEELKMFSRTYVPSRYKLVLVSVDGLALGDTTAATLGEMGLGAVESWVFADELPARVFFSVDPGWQGELPRSEFFPASGGRISHIGKLGRGQIDAWLGPER